MINRLYKTALTLALGAPVLFAASCKKDSSSSSSNNASNATKILGTWSQTFDATDADGNNVIDANEKTPLAAGDYDYNIYRSNGIVVDSSKTNSLTARVESAYVVNGEYITVSIPGLATRTGRLTQLDDHTLIVQDTSEHPAVWQGYTR